MTERIQEVIARANLPVRVEYAAGRGRYQVAARNISRGECILRENPYACVVDEYKRQKVCNSCFKLKLEGDWKIHCPNCSRVYYCSEACEAREQDVHSFECRFIHKIEPEHLFKDNLEIIKMTIRLYCSKLANKKRLIFNPGVHAKFDMIDNLLAHPKFATLDEGTKILEYIFRIMNMTDESEREAITKIYCMEETNVFRMWSKDVSGECLYAFSSFLNHSCAPTVIRRENGNVLELLAASDIPAGTELTISYTNIDQDVLSRKTRLKTLFHFDCACPKCTHEELHTSPFPLPPSLTSLECIDIHCKKYGEPLQPPPAAKNSQKVPYSVSHMCTQCYSERVYSHLWARHPELSSVMANAQVEEYYAKAQLPLKLRNSSDRGRYLIASTPISRGTCILKESPCVCIVDEAKIQKVCNSCYRHSLDGDWKIHCQNCDEVYYCSSECEQKEKEVHSLECEILKRVDPNLFARDYIEGVKMVIRFKMSKKIKRPSSLFHNNTEVAVDFDMIENLYAHEAAATVGDVPNVLEYIYQILNITSESEKAEIKHIYCLIETNSFSMWSKGYCGLSMFSLCSYFNHSCAPTVIRRENGNTIEFIAADDLPPGTELTISYTNIDKDLPTRKEKMNSGFFFDCSCPRCTHEGLHTTPFPLPSSLTALDCLDPKCSNYGKPLSPPTKISQKFPYPVSHMCTQCRSERVHSHIWARHGL